MRTIKFRAWDKGKKVFIPTNVWAVCQTDFSAFGVMLKDWEEYREGEYFYKDHQELNQFTGLTDKNGVEMFENDLVYFRANYSSKPCGYMNGQVVFEENQWMLKNENGLYSIAEETDEFYCKSEVIGNIYQNADQTN